MRYTVIGLFRDNDQVWGTQVEAGNPREAARVAVLEMLDTNGWEKQDAKSILVIDVVEGSAKFVLGNDYPVNGEELVRSPKDWRPGEKG